MAGGFDFDGALKELFAVDRPALLGRLAGGVAVREFLNVEMPNVQMPRADLVVRLADESILHLEFQSQNDPDIGYREGIYCLHLGRKYRRPVRQVVLYVGRRRLTMEGVLAVGNTLVRFDVIDIRELRAEDLLATGNTADLALATLAGGGNEMLPRIIARAARLRGAARRRLMGQILVLSGLRGLSQAVELEMSHMGVVIDIRDNPVLMRYFREAEAEVRKQARQEGLREGRQEGRQKGRQEGRQKGRQEGRQEARRQVLAELMEAKFGPLPKWAQDRIAKATTAQTHSWGRKLLTADRLEQVLVRRTATRRPAQ